MKSQYSKKLILGVMLFGAAMAAAGAVAWSAVSARAQARMEADKSAIPIIAVLAAQRQVMAFEASSTPELALRAAQSLDQVKWVMERGAQYSQTASAQAVVAEVSALDFDTILGKPDIECKATRAIDCWTYPASASGNYPSNAAAERLAIELKARSIHSKLHQATEEMFRIRNGTGRFGLLYQQAHPMQAMLDNYAVNN